MTPHAQGWNAHLDSKSQDDNPWTECSDSGHDWMRGMIDCEKACDEFGVDNVERSK